MSKYEYSYSIQRRVYVLGHGFHSNKRCQAVFLKFGDNTSFSELEVSEGGLEWMGVRWSYLEGDEMIWNRESETMNNSSFCNHLKGKLKLISISKQFCIKRQEYQCLIWQLTCSVQYASHNIIEFVHVCSYWGVLYFDNI